MKFFKHFLIITLISCPVLFAQNDNTIAVFKLDKLYSEGHNEPGLNEILTMDDSQPTFMALLSRMRRAAFDKNVKACVFYGESTGLGMAQVQELQRQIVMLKNAGKKTYFYSRTLSPGNLQAAIATDKIVLFPQGEVLFNGIQLQGMYFKRLLDKLHLKADVIHIGDFKSAGEPFYLDGPSEASKQQTQLLLNNIADQIKISLKEHRGMTIAKVNELVNKALFSAAEAKENGLIDQLAYHKDFVDSLKKEFGDNVKFNTSYGVPKKKSLQLNNIMDVFSLFNELSAPPKVDNTDKISLTVIEGAIEAQMGEKLRRHILQAAKDKTVKAMILRVNSPGGSALASEVICQAVKDFKATGKPVIVSMGNVAASGGYYVAAPGDLIYAENLTITGSIGVVGGKIVTGELMDKIGISFHTYNKGKHADLFTTLRPFNKEEKMLLTKTFQRVYETFKNRVKEGRGNKIQGDLEKIAGGRVYTGNDALKLGLVDKIGGLRDAINEAVTRTGLTRYKVSMYPKEVKLMDLISKELREPDSDEYLYTDDQSSKKSLLKKDIIKSYSESLQAINPKLGDTLNIFMKNLQMLQQERVILVSPFFTY